MPAYSNATQNIPEVFKAIIENDNKQDELRALPAIPFSQMTELLRDRRNLNSSAEKALKWNTDKGTAK